MTWLAAGHQRVDGDLFNSGGTVARLQQTDDFIAFPRGACQNPVEHLPGRRHDRKSVAVLPLEKAFVHLVLCREKIGTFEREPGVTTKYDTMTVAHLRTRRCCEPDDHILDAAAMEAVKAKREGKLVSAGKTLKEPRQK